MKAPGFRYVRPTRLEQVFDLLEAHGDGARVLAGGQSLLATLNLRLSAPDLLVDIAHLPLGGIRQTGQGIEIGALTTHREVERSVLVQRELPLLHSAMPHIAHAAIRNRGTMGGSLALADPAAEWPALAVALGARLTLRSRAGERVVPAERFFKGLYETELRPGELIVSATFTPMADRGHIFDELSRRQGDFAAAGIAALAPAEGQPLRIVLFGVGVSPVLLQPEPASGRAGWSASIADALRRQLDPPGDLHFSAASRRHLAGVLVQRALAELLPA